MRKYHKQGTGQKAGEWVVCSATVSDCPLEDITEDQYRIVKNQNLVSEQRNSAQNAEHMLKLANVQRAMDRKYIPITSYGYAKAVEDLEEVKAEAERLINEGTVEEQEAFLQERINSERFTELLNKRDETIALIAAMKEDRSTLYAKWEEDPKFSYESVRQLELSLIDANEELSILRVQINEYKDAHAPVVAAIAEHDEAMLKEKGEWREYEDDELNNLTKTAFFESGTREWLEQRQKGVGGSDVGPIIGAKGSYNSRDDIMQSKLNPITDEEVEAQAGNQSAYTGALGRGNAWEKRIFLQVRDRNPEDNITFCKTSWYNNDHTYQLANFDGLMADENGKPNGIVEIKTASDASKWGDESEGLDGVPPTYRAQTLWYAQAAGFKKGMVAVVIDEREYRQYRFDMTPELEAEAAQNRAKVEAFVKEWDQRKTGTWVGRPRAFGFSQAAANSSLRNAQKQEIFEEVAAMRGTSADEVQREFVSSVNPEQVKDPQHIREKLRQLYVETAKRSDLPDYVGVDIETAGSTPTTGAIIEYGASVRTGYGRSTLARQDTELKKTSKLYGLSKKTLQARGTGRIDVHGISASQIAKKRTFLNPSEGEAVMKQLRSTGLMLAHNAPFEKRWFNTHVPGFADAVKSGKIKILDTRLLSKRILSDVPDNSLESFTARYNIPYQGAHRAYNDAEMMSYAYERFLRELRTGVKEL